MTALLTFIIIVLSFLLYSIDKKVENSAFSQKFSTVIFI